MLTPGAGGTCVDVSDAIARVAKGGTRLLAGGGVAPGGAEVVTARKGGEWREAKRAGALGGSQEAESPREEEGTSKSAISPAKMRQLVAAVPFRRRGSRTYDV